MMRKSSSKAKTFAVPARKIACESARMTLFISPCLASPSFAHMKSRRKQPSVETEPPGHGFAHRICADKSLIDNKSDYLRYDLFRNTWREGAFLGKARISTGLMPVHRRWSRLQSIAMLPIAL